MTRNHTPIDLTRRRLLAGLGGIGLASAGAGLGTTAIFADDESFAENALVAGEFDLKVDWQVTYTGPDGFEYIDAYPDRYMNDPENPDLLATEPSPYGTIPIQGSDGIQDPILTREQIAANLGLAVDDPQVESIFRDQFADLPGPLLQQERPLVELADLKPGDTGTVTFSVHLFDNPGYLWLTGRLVENRENSVEEPEFADPDEENVEPVPEGEIDDDGELADSIRVTLWYDTDGDTLLDAGEPMICGGHEDPADNPTLAQLLSLAATDSGIPLDGDPATPFDAIVAADGELDLGDGSDPARDCFPNSTTGYLGLRWELPIDHANEIQTDSVVFDLGFYAEQCRHNDGSGQLPTGDVSA